MKIDVVVVTKNTLPDWWMEKNLARLPVNKLIIERSKPLALARMRGIQKVTTEWFAFIDDDVLLGKNWWNMIKRHIAKDVGAIDGRDYFVNYKPNLNKVINNYRKHVGDTEIQLGGRGCTVCTLMRTDVVKDWKPSRDDLSAFEDYELTQHVIKKGYRWLDVDSDALHLSWTLTHIPKQVHWVIIGIFKLQLSPCRMMLGMIRNTIVVLLRGCSPIQNDAHNIRLSMYKCYYNFWIILSLFYEGFKHPFRRDN